MLLLCHLSIFLCLLPLKMCPFSFVLQGKDIQYHSYKPALSHDDRLLNFLKRVRVLSAGHAYDLRRCQKDADALHMAVNLANSVMGVTVAILFAMLAGIIYSLYAVINAQPRYMRLEN
jgi:hypothetical protein